MSDLISRSALLDIVENRYRDIVAGAYPFNIVAYDLSKIIKEQPTAFDVEEVLKKLEEMKTKTFVSGITWNPYEFGACHAIDKVIEIVKGGVK